jgi:hypothetical protein
VTRFDEDDEEMPHPDTHEWQPESDGYDNWCVVCGWSLGAIPWPPKPTLVSKHDADCALNDPKPGHHLNGPNECNCSKPDD